MAAPVVPIQLARTVPIASSTVLAAGLPRSVPVTIIPPATVYNAHNRMMKGM